MIALRARRHALALLVLARKASRRCTRSRATHCSAASTVPRRRPSTIGLTVPAIVAVSVITGNIVLGLPPAEMILLALTLVLATLTFSGARTTILEGAMHLVGSSST